jgi:hypothetical protein
LVKLLLHSSLQTNFDAAQNEILEIDAEVTAKKTFAENLTSWAERFDCQDAKTKKSMLINLIDRITVHPDRLEINYKIKVKPTQGLTLINCETNENPIPTTPTAEITEAATANDKNALFYTQNNVKGFHSATPLLQSAAVITA